MAMDTAAATGDPEQEERDRGSMLEDCMPVDCPGPKDIPFCFPCFTPQLKCVTAEKIKQLACWRVTKSYIRRKQFHVLPIAGRR